MITADFIFTNHGSIVTLQPNSAKAEVWADFHLPADAYRFEGFVIQTSSAQPIIDGIEAEGLTIHVQGV